MLPEPVAASIPTASIADKVGETILTEAGIVAFVLFCFCIVLGVAYWLERRDHAKTIENYNKDIKEMSKENNKVVVSCTEAFTEFKTLLQAAVLRGQ